MSTTKKQWETIFTSNASPTSGNTEASGVKKKAQPKWEVRLPYKERHPAPSATSPGDQVSDSSPVSTMSSSGLVLLVIPLHPIECHYHLMVPPFPVLGLETISLHNSFNFVISISAAEFAIKHCLRQQFQGIFD